MRSNVNERLAHIATPFGKSHAADYRTARRRSRRGREAEGNAHRRHAVRESELRRVQGGLNSGASIAYAISAKTRNDEDRLSTALGKILEEDRSLRFYRDPLTKEFLLAGNGQQHVEVVVSRLKRRYGVEVELHAPKIPYRETVRGTASVQGRHKKQTGGHGQFGDCWIRIEPLPRGEKISIRQRYLRRSRFRGNSFRRSKKALWKRPSRAFVAGYPVTDFKVTVYDGSYHDVDSSEMAFKLAGRKAFRAAMQQAKPALLEPVMRVDVETPTDSPAI